MGYPCIREGALKKFLKEQGATLHITKKKILKKGKSSAKISCFWCSWNRRKALFETANRFGCTKVAFGHHRDDIIETTLLNLFFQGEISTMCPKQELFKGKIIIIRPLAYVEEYMIVKFARSAGLPDHNCKCPNSEISNRAKMGKLISEMKKTCPDVKKNIYRSLQRVKKDYLL